MGPGANGNYGSSYSRSFLSCAATQASRAAIQAQVDGAAATEGPIVVENHFLADPRALYTFTPEENLHVDFE
jgi:hypothetical protein